MGKQSQRHCLCWENNCGAIAYEGKIIAAPLPMMEKLFAAPLPMMENYWQRHCL
jgi:hypothetical protein